MTTSITMPQLGETILEGTIIKWLKKEGEMIAEDEPLFEISTDKVDTEVPSPAAGTVTKILVAEGETVAVGTELATIDDGASSTPDEKPEQAAGGPVEPAASATTAAPTAAEQIAAPADRGGRSLILSPKVRQLAREHGVDLSLVTGTGAGGRITRKDVEAFVASGPATAATPAIIPAKTGSEEAPALRIVRPSEGAREEVVPLTHIRKQIAAHMHESLQVSARAWSMVEVDMENVARLRVAAKEGFREREGFSLTYMPFVSRAVCDALLEYPAVNAELRGEELVLRRYVNLGIAVAYEDGLIVPVVKDAEGMNLLGLAQAINGLAVRARTKRLAPDDVQGSTFTITNPGPFGSVMSVPIINQPNSAILSLDAIEKRPVVIDDAIAIRHRVYLSMSWDHRVIDGAVASQFLGRIKTNLETWDFAEDLGR